MNELEQERIEAELKRLTPARLPENFRNRLVAAEPPAKIQPPPKATVVSGIEAWLRILRWLAPATAVAVAAVVTLSDFKDSVHLSPRLFVVPPGEIGIGDYPRTHSLTPRSEQCGLVVNAVLRTVIA